MVRDGLHSWKKFILQFLLEEKLIVQGVSPIFMETLGSQFLSHPPIEPYTVTVADGDHPLVEG
ncbi:hypothetical protein Ct9H90mP29_21610 [bacterium]|nr:MAG: hypothetical protein Ct9H90mP29_21610 [bacterium]